jgi:hypothetical protein
MNTIKGKFYSAVTDENGDMILSFTVTGSDRYSARNCVKKIKGFKEKGKEFLKIDLGVWRDKRSLDANSYFHVLADKIAGAMQSSMEEIKRELVLKYGTIARDENGIKVGFALRHDIDIDLVCKYAQLLDTVTESGVIFNRYIVYKRTSELDSKEFARLLDGTVSECRELGIETKTPAEIANMISLIDSGVKSS